MMIGGVLLLGVFVCFCLGKDDILRLNQSTFESALEEHELTLIEFVKSSGKTSEWMEALRDDSSKLQKDVGFARLECTPDNLPLASFIHMRENCDTQGRDVMLYQRSLMQYHIMPNDVQDTADSVVEWIKAELNKPPVSPSGTKADFDWSKLANDEFVTTLDDESFEKHASTSEEERKRQKS
jgi:hypothetical protein